MDATSRNRIESGVMAVLLAMLLVALVLPARALPFNTTSAKFMVERVDRFSTHTQIVIAFPDRMQITPSPCGRIVINTRFEGVPDPNPFGLSEERHKQALEYLEMAQRDGHPVSFGGVLDSWGECEIESIGINYAEEGGGDVFMSFVSVSPSVEDRGSEAPVLPKDKIAFPNGEVVAVSWRPRDARRAQLPDPPWGQIYFDLRERAQKGEGWAAYHLSRVLELCQGAWENPDDLERAIEHARETYIVETPVTKLKVTRGPRYLEREIDSLIRSFEQCVGLTRMQKTDADQWMKEAADAGVVPAMLSYGQSRENKDEAGERYLMKAWQAGDPEALAPLGSRYNHMHFVESEEGDPPGNLVREYAAFYAYTKLYEKFASRENLKGRLWYLEQRERQLSPEQIDQGRALAKALIEDNENCCLQMTQ